MSLRQHPIIYSALILAVIVLIFLLTLSAINKVPGVQEKPTHSVANDNFSIINRLSASSPVPVLSVEQRTAIINTLNSKAKPVAPLSDKARHDIINKSSAN
jgi:hypothetical protein